MFPRRERADTDAIGRPMFTIADKRAEIADAVKPPGGKMLIASALAIYPLILFVLPAIRPYTEQLPKWLGALATVAVLTPLSTLVMIPLVSRALRRWLYRPAPPSSTMRG